MKDIKISLKKLIKGLETDIKAEKYNYDARLFPKTSYDERCCSLIRIAYIKDLILRLKDNDAEFIKIMEED